MGRRDVIIGHGDHRYKVLADWGRLNAAKHPVMDCHEMVIDRKGRIILLTNHIKNNILIYDQNGRLLDAWGTSYPGAHGLTIKDEGGEDYLYITDTVRNLVVKTDVKGREIFTMPYPAEISSYTTASQYKPTETAIGENGRIYVADGYGEQYIIVYDQRGVVLNYFGGRGAGDDQFYNAHGIAIDSRTGRDRLLVTARQKNQLKYFDLDGEYESTTELPGAFICRPVIKDKNVYLATIWSDDGAPNTGFITILDEHNRVVSVPGGSEPQYEDDQLQSMYQTVRIFKHPHDVCIDQDDNMYVPQWNAGQVYPMKLIRV